LADRQLFATLVAAALENSAAIFGFHARSEANILGSTSLIWLKCSLWHT
jgi:hypothetical protein